ncbi:MULTISPECIES: tRNA (adenosine(37)-N6)-threonylcarbamoyltransferase complex ATPase subunit type 1 TsaE [Vitreoscilla]|uniref:tRNA threonylcarbamoyladenosine biosynthesis protein TsaE n=1 Tax=Vitreoscilla stercoraria TaxID=61 RepID=A0ABY4EBE1_VITST|nr:MULTISPECIES: tRNA (adenosine(37)-N6)-threonylcarbamoyltransferase complex ATPase subunit type 1 TsaE [Vitreoscilla]AUZ05517.1 tRNA threonylcarbamoyl adenosine modification protein TsaE [Vitreoscilla sp. C1]UOO93070.1 tRNA (adenosine(37)-N6)-threonylcarbamoyltransferase complex ATPase subunit type 1 TsaE [Vitreoscilla stercoraria]
MADYTQFLADEAASLALAHQLAAHLQPALTVYLAGDLGAGKTTLTRGLLRALGFDGTVKSPTYTIVESYELDGLKVEHFDLYRFQSPEEWMDAGLDELFDANTIALIEWPQMAEGFVPQADMTIALSVQDEGRLCTITAHHELAQKMLTSCFE